MTLTSPLAQRSSNAFASGKLQGYVPGVILLTSLALSWALFSAFRPADAEYEVNLIVVVLAAIAIFAVLLWGVSYRVEGRRRAVDRLAGACVDINGGHGRCGESNDEEQAGDQFGQ